MAKKTVLISSVVLAGLLVGAGYTVWRLSGGGGEFVVSGIIEADDVHVGSKAGGRVLKVVAREGQGVKAGEVLVLFEPEEPSASLAEAEARLRQLESGYRKEEIAQVRAAAEMARARVERLKTQLDETVVRAPFDAVVDVLDLEPGDMVGPGRPVATLLRPDGLWVRAYLPEEKLGFVRPGLEVKVRVDSFPGKSFPGVVRRVHRQAEFTPRNVQTQEERVLQVFQTEVVIIDPDQVLRPGMNADVIIPGR